MFDHCHSARRGESSTPALRVRGLQWEQTDTRRPRGIVERRSGRGRATEVDGLRGRVEKI